MWVKISVPYNEGGWYQGYREDCSGFVSMAWVLPAPGLTTYTLPTVSHPINKDDLQPGDILLNQWGGWPVGKYGSPDAHVVIFDSWADSMHMHYNAFEEDPYYGEANYTTNIPYPFWPGYDSSDYVPMRLNNLSNSPTILPGGVWTDPSPKDGQMVSDVIHFAAHAYPTHPGDPAIAQVNFTIGSQGTWKVACTVVPPATGDVFACDVNLKDLGISYGQIQVSFDVYDQAGNINLAPNGVHTLTYAPTPQPVPTPTQPPTLEVKPSSFVASDPSICPNGKCEMTLSSPNSNAGNIDWKATITIRPGAGTGIIGSVSPSSGTLAPGQTITVSFRISSSICGDITGSTITFTGGVSPVVVQLSGSFGPC